MKDNNMRQHNESMLLILGDSSAPETMVDQT